MTVIIEFLVELLWGILCWAVLFPVIWLAAMPFVLVFALRDSEPYQRALITRFKRITKWWAEFGIIAVPP